VAHGRKGKVPAALAGLLLLVNLLAALAPVVSAHPPSGVSVEYLPGLSQLNVSITHVVFGTEHYVFKVEIRKNNVLEITQDYDSQPTFTTFNYTYTIAAQNGDTLSATAYCSLGGDSTGFTTVSTGPPPDTTSPTIRIVRPSNLQVFNTSDIPVNGTASDDVALAKVEVRVNSGAWTAASGTTAWSSSVTLVKGTNRIDAMATDTSGNTAAASVNVTYEEPAPPPPPVDTTPPSISITAPPEGSIFTSAGITVNGTASDNVGVSRVEARVGTGAWALASGNTSWSVDLQLAEGTNTIEARATDAAGNTANATVPVIYARPGGAATLDGTVSVGEYDFKRTFGGGSFELHWKVTGEVIRLAMVGRTTGWVAIGLEPTQMMKDADMIGGWVDSRGKPGILDCFSTGSYGPHPPDTSLSPPGRNDILEYGGSEAGGRTTIEFTRLLRTKDSYDRDIPSNGTLDFIWALGSGDDFNFQHLGRGHGSIDITTGAGSEPPTMAWQPHAALLSAGLVVLVAGMFVARLRTQRWWMKGHRAVMLAGAALAATGLLYGYFMVQEATGMHLRVPHSFLGVLSLVMTLGMTASGLVVLRVARKHPSMRPVHRWAGRATILLLVLTVLSGLVQAGVLKL